MNEIKQPCTCGAGGAPARCLKHPEVFAMHRAQIDLCDAADVHEAETGSSLVRAAVDEYVAAAETARAILWHQIDTLQKRLAKYEGKA